MNIRSPNFSVRLRAMRDHLSMLSIMAPLGFKTQGERLPGCRSLLLSEETYVLIEPKDRELRQQLELAGLKSEPFYTKWSQIRTEPGPLPLVDQFKKKIAVVEVNGAIRPNEALPGLNKLLDEVYERFLDHVAESRKMDRARVEEWALLLGPREPVKVEY